MARILYTGGGSRMGRVMREHLGGRYEGVVLHSRRPHDFDLLFGESVEIGDLDDLDSLTRAAKGVEIMRCLKRYAAREVYRQITNPQPAPNNADLRQRRTALGCTITTAARELDQWPSKISLL